MKRFSGSILTLVLSVLLLYKADAQDAADADLKVVLSDTSVPLSIRMKDIDGNWRRFSVTGTSASSMKWQVMGAAAGVEFGVHFTRGQTVTIGDQTFLIAYRFQPQIDARFFNWHGHGDPPRPRKPSDLTELSLSLLNLRTTGSLNDLRPFNPSTDMENTEQANAASVRTLTQLGQGVMRYLRARGSLPRLRNPIPWDAGRVFYPYVGDERLYMHPSTQEMYRYNEVLGGKKIVHIKDRQSMAIFYEATPGGDGTRGVLFLDGHVERLTPDRWRTIMKASKITEVANIGGTGEGLMAPTTVVVNAPPPP